VHGGGAVQATGGLIQHDDGGVDQQLLADGHTLALTTTDATPEEATCRGMEGRVEAESQSGRLMCTTTSVHSEPFTARLTHIVAWSSM